MQGVPNPCGYHPRKLMRAPIGNFSHTSTNRLVIPTSQPGEPSAILATNYATKKIEGGKSRILIYQWFNERWLESRRPSAPNESGLSESLLENLSGPIPAAEFAGQISATRPIVALFC